MEIAKADKSTTHAAIARLDIATAARVDVGIELQRIIGTGPAAAYLRTRGIGLRAALRVLTVAARRRHPFLALTDNGDSN